MLIKRKNYIRKKNSHQEGFYKEVILSNGIVPNLLQFAISKFKKGDKIEPHSHVSMSEVFFILKGKVKVYCGSNNFIAEKEDTIFIATGRIHYFHFLEDSELLYFNIKTEC
jgi:quercetin dioxygenase-like cupin family protein